MGIEVTQVDTCTCPWCTTAVAAANGPGTIPDVAGGGTVLLPPPMPTTTAYHGADWATMPPLAGTDETAGTALALPAVPWVGATVLAVNPNPAITNDAGLAPVPTAAPATTTAAPVAVPIVPANIGTPFADAIGFTNPFLDAGPTDELPVHDARIDPTT